MARGKPRKKGGGESPKRKASLRWRNSSWSPEFPFLIGLGCINRCNLGRRRDRGVQGASGISGVVRAQQAERVSHGPADCACNAPRAAPLSIRLVLVTTAYRYGRNCLRFGSRQPVRRGRRPDRFSRRRCRPQYPESGRRGRWPASPLWADIVAKVPKYLATIFPKK